MSGFLGDFFIVPVEEMDCGGLFLVVKNYLFVFTVIALFYMSVRNIRYQPGRIHVSAPVVFDIKYLENIQGPPMYIDFIGGPSLDLIHGSADCKLGFRCIKKQVFYLKSQFFATGKGFILLIFLNV